MSAQTPASIDLRNIKKRKRESHDEGEKRGSPSTGKKVA
jgi:hypothetical protein